jgi:protein-S-isoprenylcysteine O-methyltransferase Ste14
MEIIGKPTINPFLFFSGKICGYTTWIILGLTVCGVKFLTIHSLILNKYLAIPLLVAGLFFSILSSVNLGHSTRLGLPAGKTSLRLSGLYKFSRNPMYVGFNLITISSMIYTLNLVVILPGLYSIFVYHLIIMGEETFLEKRFGVDYLNYKKRVRRYF